jgi:hypothetical protein
MMPCFPFLQFPIQVVGVVAAPGRDYADRSIWSNHDFANIHSSRLGASDGAGKV